MIEINPVLNQVREMRTRLDDLRGYL